MLPSVHESINTPSVSTAVRESVEHPLTDQVIGRRFGEELENWLRWSDGHDAGGFLYSLSMFFTKVTWQMGEKEDEVAG